ncbi:MAG: hypothetical protein HY079_00275 [Elusimicrobia bacterium]|nr:hypothetical protein [Elusimicrobiota bacterium]
MERPSVRAVAAIVLLAGLSTRASADVVTLSNGVTMTGVLSTTDDGLTLRVSQDGFVVLDSATIVGVQRASKDENEKLVAGWKSADEEAAREDQARAKYADEQRAKGMVQYQGEWMTPSQFDRRLALDRLEVDKLREARAAAPSVSYSYHYYYSVPSSQIVYQSFGYPRRSSSRGIRRSSSYTVPLAPAGVRTYGVRPSLFDHEAGMGAGSHYGW